MGKTNEELSTMFTKAASIGIVAGAGKGACNRSTGGALQWTYASFHRKGDRI